MKVDLAENNICSIEFQNRWNKMKVDLAEYKKCGIEF